MTAAAEAGRERELAIAAEQEQDWPWGVWTRESLDRLWAEYGEVIPWNDAGEKSGSEEAKPGNLPAAGDETAA